MTVRMLVVDDDPIVADSLREYLAQDDIDAASAYNAEEALAAIAQAEEKSANGSGQPFGIVMTDVSMPGMNGVELLREINRRFPSIVVIMLTGYGTIESAVEALRMGAIDYLTKPVIDEELRLALERATRQQKILQENRALKQRLDGRFGLGGIIGSDHRMQRIYELVEAVAPSKTTVLMTGESGTGKSLIAGAIHQRSPRRDNPFVEISCGSIPETLLESELFGHVRGAFTGAHADKTGRFLAANGGTIFLDEINSASPGMQLKLLRVLQERRFEPVGSGDTIEVDARVILASNQHLEQLVASGEFRQDLYYRINVVKIELPPLRERVSDIPALAQHFLAVHAEQLGRELTGFSDEALESLRRYPFPGNVRELQNIIERAAVLTRSTIIQLTDLPPHVIDGKDQGLLKAFGGSSSDALDDDTPWVPMPLVEAIRDPERRILLKALTANDWNRQQTADDLAINRTTLYKKMKQLGIDDRDDRRAG